MFLEKFIQHHCVHRFVAHGVNLVLVENGRNHLPKTTRLRQRKFYFDYRVSLSKVFKMAVITIFYAIPALDIAADFRQARCVETPPILPPVADAPKPRRKGRKKLIVFILLAVAVLGTAMF